MTCDGRLGLRPSRGGACVLRHATSDGRRKAGPAAFAGGQDKGDWRQASVWL